MSMGFGLTPVEKDAQRVNLWNNLKEASKLKRVSRNIDKRPDPDGEAFIITRDFKLVFHTSKNNIEGWIIRKKIEFGLYSYDFYQAKGDWLYFYQPLSETQFEHITEGTTMCSWIGYSNQLYSDLTKQFASMPRYEGGTYVCRETFEQDARDRMVVLGEYISEIKKGLFYNGNEYHGAVYLPDLNRNADMMRSFIDGKLPVMSDIQHLTTVPIEGLVRVEKFIKGKTYSHLSYVNADNAEKKYANALFEAVADLRANLPSTTYNRRLFDDYRYAEHMKPLKDMIDYFARYEGHFKRERCLQFIHNREPYSFTQVAANLVKFYLIYRKKRLAYTAFICSEKINRNPERIAC